MRFTLGQELRQEQKQILTQRMIQSMEILQLPMLQLEERIDQELEKNPVLELEMDPVEQTENSQDEESFGETATAETEESETSFEYEPEIRFDSNSDSKEEFQIADDFAQNYSDTIDELPARSQNWLEDQDERRADAFANIPSPSQTLQDYLTEQLGWFDLSPPLRAMAERIINNLDPNGYFPFDLNDFLGQSQTSEEPALAAEALAIIRKLDPSGVGGKDLKDCLLLQVRETIPNADILRILILSHLEDISANRLPHIVRVTGFSLEAIQEAIAELRHLNPRPGADFYAQSSAVIIPDVIVEKNDEGQYVVRLEEGRSQQLHVSGYYRDLMKDRGTEKGTRDYIKQKVGSAQWLIEAIEQRRTTLRKVSQAIVDYQIDFFEIGPHALKPLKMQQIADVVGVHVTTVSRACDEKWMMTPQGVFPLKRFFTGAIAASDGGEEVAQDTVRLKLREIIEKEDKHDPLSDDAIVKLLDDAGIRVARRTVVKYRHIMKIPSSRKRKVWNT
ncbi:MAG: RNA polymerase factor sigma-54 [Planctomycetaceae bacterium]|jgi:RNA polymerase sigma-54 factor|nr:RNA polymerase factor sigma-54 [Planctomycetaceae bacterium]